MSTIFDVVLAELHKPFYKYENKELLATKLEYAGSFEEAYLTDEEKAIVNRILEAKRIPVRIH